MQTDKRKRMVSGEDPRAAAERNAEIDRLLHAHFAGDLERRVAAARGAGGDAAEAEAAELLTFSPRAEGIFIGLAYGVFLGAGGVLVVQGLFF